MRYKVLYYSQIKEIQNNNTTVKERKYKNENNKD